MRARSTLLGSLGRPIIAAGVLTSVFFVLAVAPSSASATMETHWHTPPACVTTTALGPRVEALTKRGPSHPVALSLGADQRGGAWTISLHMTDAHRRIERTLHGRDCGTLTEAVALVVAVQLDAMAVSESLPVSFVAAAPPGPVPEPAPSHPDPSSVPEPEAQPPEPVVTAVPASEPSPRTSLAGPRDRPPSRASPPPHPRAVVGLGGAGELGVLPGGGGAVELSAGAVWPRARLEFGGLGSFGPGARQTQPVPIGGRFTVLTTVTRACGVIARRRFELPLCAALELGAVRATSLGTLSARTINSLWVAATPGFRPQWVPTPRLAVGGFIDLAVPLIRHRYTATLGNTDLIVHQLGAAAIRLGLRVELRLP